VRVLALDYGSVRTGVAISDASGTLARPVSVVKKAATEKGLAEIAAIVIENEVEQIVVGLPLTLRGEHGKQAAETDVFVIALRDVVSVPVETADERFTTALAQRFGGSAPQDAVAAAHLLQSWLDAEARR
jgi:putative pre-16S rRNA nuclease